MVPYQIYKMLTDQRIRDLEANARRHERRAAAYFAPAGPTEPSSRFSHAFARMMALVHVPKGTRTGSKMTSPTGAGPMGCAA